MLRTGGNTYIGRLSHLNFEDFIVDLVHAFDLGELDGVPILEAMTDFVQAGDDTLSVPGNA